jgi:peptide/nickel transport system permease protein
MRDYVFRRLLWFFPVLLGVSLVVFFFIHMIPGDPVMVMLGESARPGQVEALRHSLHLDQPLYMQLVLFFSDLFQGEMVSIFFQKPVMEVILPRLGATLELAVFSMLIAILIALPIGILSALKKNSWIDFASRVFSLAGVSLPNFWLGPLLIILFSIILGWLPVTGRGGVSHLILPSLTLGMAMAGLLSRISRASMLEVLSAPYLMSGRARGLGEMRIILRHALRNALIPILTVIGLQFGALLSGAFITETIFAWPGIGRLLINAIFSRDFPLVQACVLVIAASYLTVNLLVDLAYAFVDARVRLWGEK